MTVIEKVIQNSSNIRTLIFSDTLSLSASAGQFAMVWLPGVGEFPMSLSLNYEKKSSIVVKAMGPGSLELYNAKVGNLIGIRGPYGIPFSIPKKSRRVLLVGGGTGIAPIIKLAREIPKTIRAKIVIGARTKAELPYLTQMKRMVRAENVYPTTDDGSLGFKGFAHEKVKEIVEDLDFDLIYSCGPEKMMFQIYEIAKQHSMPVQFSLERIMKCGIAICGSCCIGGIVLCKDGPVLDSKMLSRISNEFGRYARDKTGALVAKI